MIGSHTNCSPIETRELHATCDHFSCRQWQWHVLRRLFTVRCSSELPTTVGVVVVRRSARISTAKRAIPVDVGRLHCGFISATRTAIHRSASVDLVIAFHASSVRQIHLSHFVVSKLRLWVYACYSFVLARGVIILTSVLVSLNRHQRSTSVSYIKKNSLSDFQVSLP